MRVSVQGDRDLVNGLKAELSRLGIALADFMPTYSVHLDYADRGNVLIDSVDGDLERRIINWIAVLLEQHKVGTNIELQREGGIRNDLACRILVPNSPKVSRLVELGIASALAELKTSKKWWTRIFAICVLVVFALPAYAQSQSPSGPQHVICDAGCAGGGGGGAAQLQVRNAGDTAWVNVGFNAANLAIPATLQTGANVIGSISNTGFNVNNFPATYDTSDRAARLLGIIYGSQSQQLQQSAANFNLFTELRTGATAYDARQIRALTAADVVTSQQGTAPWSFQFRNPGNTVFLGDAANPVRTDPTGSTTQPVSGTVTANQGGAPWSADVTDRAARLLGIIYGSQGQQLQQSGTNFNLFTELRTAGTAYDARQIRALTNADVVKAQLQDNAGTGVTVGQKPMATSLPVAIASDQSNVPVTVSNLPATQPVSGTVTVNGALPGAPAVIPVMIMSGPPTLSGKVASNPLLYRDAMKNYCYQNLAGCAPSAGGLR